jgi:flagellar FliJ protein
VKRYRFRLEPVLRARRLQQDVARLALAEATAAVGRAEAAEARAQGWLDGLRDEPAPSEPQAWEARRRVQLLAAAELVARGAEVGHARAEQRARQAALAEARKAVRALERLDERRRAEHALEVARLDGLAADDLVTSRYRRRTA